MTYTNPPRRAVYPPEKTLTEQSVPSPPGGAARWLLGILSLVPGLLVALAIVWRLRFTAETGMPVTRLAFSGIYGLIGANLAVLFYIVLALKNRYLEPMQRLGWAVVIIFLAPIALPVFWYRHILHPLRYGRPVDSPVDHTPAGTPRRAT